MAASTTQYHHYNSVHVLCLSWRDDELNVEPEVKSLGMVFTRLYGFDVHYWDIPSNKANELLDRELESFFEMYESPGSLLIIYYAGHGSLGEHNRRMAWHCTSDAEGPSVLWDGLQWRLENANCDVLLILDCCNCAPTSRKLKADTKKWLLGACGFSREAVGPGEQSFTRSLTDELINLVAEPFSTTELHRRVENRLRHGIGVGGNNRREDPQHIPLGEGGREPVSIRITSYHCFPINLIAIMGPTGSGKSSFINTITGRPVRETGGGLESTTEEAECEYMVLNGVPVTLIDTPGFDDTYLTEAQVLKNISSYLIKMYEYSQKLTGVLYLRDIHDKKMKGSEKRNTDLFLSLCGEKYLSNVRLVTTKWDDEAEAVDVVEGRERELREKFWAHMEKLGCSYSKYYNTQGSANEIVNQMLNLTPDYLQIQEELGAKRLTLGQTAAGRIIELGQKQKLSELQQRMKEVKKKMEQMRKSHNAALEQALEDQRREIEEDMKEMEGRNRILEQNYKNLLKKTKSPDTSFLLKQLMERWDQKLPADMTVKQVAGIGALGAVGVAGLIAASWD